MRIDRSAWRVWLAVLLAGAALTVAWAVRPPATLRLGAGAVLAPPLRSSPQERLGGAQGTAVPVRAYLERTVRPRVLLLEGALVTANQQMLAYCRAVDLRELSVCFGPGLDWQTPRRRALRQALAQQAGVLASLSAQFSALPLVPLAPEGVTRQMDRLTEDLAACSAQLADLLAGHAHLMAVLATLPPSAPLTLGPDVTVSRLDYAARMQSAVQLLRRAEAWLAMIDRESGAHATLPGFAGGRDLEEHLSL